MSPITGFDLSEVAVEPVRREASLPARDVRKAMDEAVRRKWTEQTRRFARGAVLLTGDTVMGLAGVAVVLNTWWLVSNGGLRPVPDAIPLIAMVCCIQPLALRATGAYSGGRSRVSVGRIASALILASLIGWVQARLFGYMSPSLPNKTAYLYSGAVIALLVWLERMAFDAATRAVFRAGILQRRVLLIAHRDEVEELQRRVDHSAASDVRVTAALSPRELVGGMERLEAALAMTDATGVVIASSLPMDMIGAIMAQCFRSGVAVSMLPRGIQGFGSAYFELNESKIGVLLQAFPMRLGLPQLAVKRTMDVVLTVMGLAVIWPVFPIVALLIKLDSKGPVFFRQERMGVGGKRFKIVKFRTMVADAEAQKAALQHLNEYGNAKLFKIKDDPRITKLGRFLRKSSLDELPQLWNVLRGEMSLVGPRPCVPAEFKEYEERHLVRLFVVPGVTGPWQVNGRNNIKDFEEVVRLDQEYIRSWSLFRDFVILLKTIPTLIGRGAY